MKTIELRRHGLTKHGDGRGRGSHLSQKGVDCSRPLRAVIGPFDAVFASVVPRTLETAIAMGFAVNDVIDGDHGLWEASQTEVPSHSQREWPGGFSGYRAFVDHDGPLARFAFYYANLWRAVADSLPPKRSALVIGHGGLLEPALVVCLAIYDTTWGPPSGHLEGARLQRERR